MYTHVSRLLAVGVLAAGLPLGLLAGSASAVTTPDASAGSHPRPAAGILASRNHAGQAKPDAPSVTGVAKAPGGLSARWGPGTKYRAYATMPYNSSGSARAAVISGWRLVQQFGICESDGALAVTATSASNAWATGQQQGFNSGNCGPGHLLIAHWDGTKWSTLQPPAGFGGDVGGAVASLSASYAWVFAHRGSTAPGSALLWGNGQWRAFQLADGAVISSAVVFSQSNAWGFGSLPGKRPAAYAVHFNGHSWQPVTVPVLPQGTASPAPDNIWAVGPLASATGQPIPQPYALAHWTGTAWQTIPFPQLHLPKGEGVTNAWVVSDNAQGAWVAGDVRNKSLSKVGGVLLHWTGSSWVNVTIPFQTSGLGPLSHDAQGGLWINNCPSDGFAAACEPLDMAHYNNAGQWSQTRVTLPAATEATATAMRLIPGTNSVWASAILYANGTFWGGMLKYGP